MPTRIFDLDGGVTCKPPPASAIAAGSRSPAAGIWTTPSAQDLSRNEDTNLALIEPILS